MLNYQFNPCEAPDSTLFIDSPRSVIKSLTDTAPVDVVLKIYRKNENGQRIFDPSKTYLSRGGVPQTHEMLYGQLQNTSASDFYFLTFILGRDQRIHYNLGYPLLEVQLSPQFGRPKIVGNRLHQDVENILRPKDLETVEYTRDAILLELGKLCMEATSINPTLWTVREEIPTPNFTIEWPLEDLAELVESQKCRFTLADGRTIYTPDLGITERLIQKPIKTGERGIFEMPPNLVVPTELERRAMGYKGIKLEAA